MSKPPPTNFNANGKALKQAIDDVGKYNSLVYFATDSKSVGKLDTGKCMAVSEYDKLPSVAMKPLDGNLHTPESCKLNAGIIQSTDKWQTFIGNKKTNNVISERGLQYKVVDGYFADNPDFFKSAKVLSTGVAKKFNSITDSTNGYIQRPNSATQHRYSVEWIGTFTPPTTGPWHFLTASDDASYMWIGKYALSNMSAKNSIVRNGNLHGLRGAAGQINLQAGVPYPIRFQFGENWGGHNFYIQVHGLDPKTRRWVYYNNFADMVTPDVNVKDTKLYYALVEETQALSASGLYNCYISDTTNSNTSITKNNFKYKIIWSAFDEKNEHAKLQPGNYANYRNNELVVYDKDGNILKQIGTANVKPLCPDNAKPTGPDMLKLDNTGNIIIRGKAETTVNATDALVNPMWITEKYVLSRSDILTSAEGDSIRRTSWDNQQLLISENGKFKLEISENGNLVIKVSLSGCSGSTSDGTKYTTTPDNLLGKNYYLYEAEADMKMDKTFVAYARNNVRTLKAVDVNGSEMKKGDSFTEYANFAPSNVDGAVTVDNIAACKTKCTDDKNCDYYYSYITSDGKNNCKTGTNNGLTPFIPIQPKSEIKSSQLYIRKTDMNLPSADDHRNKVPKISTSDYANYAAYNVSPALYELGSTGITAEIDAAVNKQKNIVNGTKRMNIFKRINGFKGMEGFNDHGYTRSEVLNAKYADEPTPDGLATAMQTQQIKPMTQIAGDYNALMANINSEYNTIGTNVSAATSLRDDLKNDKKSGYLDNNYEMMPHAKRVEDVRLDDINELISQTNTAYTLGTITAMTLIIAGIFVMRN
jgi:hypothetical protein